MKDEYCLVFKVNELQIEEIKECFSYEYTADTTAWDKLAFSKLTAFSSPRKEAIIGKISELTRKENNNEYTYTLKFESLCKKNPTRTRQTHK